MLINFEYTSRDTARKLYAWFVSNGINPMDIRVGRSYQGGYVIEIATPYEKII